MMGITLCSTTNENTYMISCDYVRGCGRENCSYTLTSMNNSLTDTVQGSSLIRITDQGIIYHLTVTDIDEFVVQSEEFSFSASPTATKFSLHPYSALLLPLWVACFTKVDDLYPSAAIADNTPTCSENSFLNSSVQQN